MTDATDAVKQAAMVEINTKLGFARALIKEAQDIAEKHKLSFDWDLAYGMGGTFYGDAAENYNYNEVGWIASSHSC